MGEALIAVLGAAVGYVLSQLLNLIEFFRRPRFRIVHFSDGVLSAYTGDPPDTPWEVELGFSLENCGTNPAKGLRVFVSQMMVFPEHEPDGRPTILDIVELRRPIDLLPPGESVAIKLGTISSDSCSLLLNKAENSEEDDLVDCDTRGSKSFDVRVYVCRDNDNSSRSFNLKFRPGTNGLSEELLRDYDEIDWMKFGTSMFDPYEVWPKDSEGTLPELR